MYMEKTKVTDVSVIKETLTNALTYSEYLEGIEEVLKAEAKTDEEIMIQDYTKLNAARIKRLDRTQKISQEAQNKIKSISKNLYWIVITEGWCGDAAHSVPVLNKLSELNSNIEMKLVLRDENLELMDRYLTNGGRSIPKLIIYDPETEKVLGTWGPRPAAAAKLLLDYKAKHGVIDGPIKQELQLWYNKNKGQDLMEEIVELHQHIMNL